MEQCEEPWNTMQLEEQGVFWSQDWTWVFCEGAKGAFANMLMFTLLPASGEIKSFVSDPGVSCLLLESMKQQQANLFTCK